MTQQSLMREFILISKHRMVSHYLPKLNLCLERVNVQQLWSKEAEHLNSIGGIILHVMEHIRRNTERIKNPGRVDMYNLYHLVEHAGYHLGQIVDRVHKMTAQPFQFVDNGINEKNLREIIKQEDISVTDS